MKEYTYNDLDILIQKLKKNESSVPRELLLTQYAASYNSLRNQISNIANDLFRSDVLCGISVDMTDTKKADDILSKINAAIHEEKKPGGIIDQAIKTLFTKYNVWEFQKYADKMRDKIWRIYDSYWLERYYLKDSSAVFVGSRSLV